MKKGPEGFEHLGEMDLGKLPEYWAKSLKIADHIETIEARWGRDAGLTDRKFDEAQPAGHRCYFAAYGYLQSGAEHIDALRGLLTLHGATPRAPWTLLRSIYEAGFWSCWLLEPDQGLERRRRGLRVEARSWKERKNFYDTFLRTDLAKRDEVRLDHAKDLEAYKKDAKDLTMSWDTVLQKVNVVAALEELQVVKAMEPLMQAGTIAMWRSLSGMQHNLIYALVMSSDRRHEQKIHGGVRAQLSINDERFQVATMAAMQLFVAGQNLYVTRSSRVAPPATS